MYATDKHPKREDYGVAGAPDIVFLYWSKRREDDGIQLRVSREGVEVYGVFDERFYRNGGAVTWEELDAIRVALEGAKT